MRIVSNFRDYYDVGQSLGQDQSIVYVRTTLEVPNSEGLRNPHEYRHPDGRVELTTPMIEDITIGFCGGLYPVYRLRYHHDRQDLDAWCYSLEDADRFIEQIKKESSREHFREAWEYGNALDEPGLRSQFSIQGKLKLIETFQQYNTPIFVWQPWKMTINPILRPYDFFRVKDAYTAFQEVQQFVSGTLGSSVKPMPVVPDEDMQEIKGFDHKYSFRKEPRQ